MTGSNGFARALTLVDGVQGWLTDAQARALYDAAQAVGPGGRIVEIGSFRGRSTIILASALPDGVELVAIDPHGGGDRGPQEIAPDATRGDEDHAAFVANLERAGVSERVRHVREMSQDALQELPGPVTLLFVDGAHRYRPASDDIARWGERVPVGGAMLIHDAFNAVGVTLAQVRLLVASKRWRYEGRRGSLAIYRRSSLSAIELASNALAQLVELPYFVRNGLVKVLLLARLRALAHLLGHGQGDWPY
ncbi:MAG: class I SAM-dependent methyltransferase [Solirubrobacteraceae bacterium]